MKKTALGEHVLRPARRPFTTASLFAAALCILLTATAWATPSDILTFSNSGGTAGTSAIGALGPFTLTDSSFTGMIGGQSVSGLMSFSTGNSFTGSLSGGGFWASGGTFTLTETSGPVNGILFSGTFSSDVNWTLDTPGCTAACVYTLSGAISGNYFPNGPGGPSIFIGSGAISQITILSNGQYGGGSFILSGPGTTSLQMPGVTPEPGTLLLMGTGMAGLAWIKRRKWNR